MSLLDTVKTPDDRAPIITILGEAGVGKTNLAATFPDAIFIRIEDGMQAIPMELRPKAFDVVTKVEDLFLQLNELIRSEHDFKTLVIDSVTKLDRLFETHVIETDPKKPKSINQAMGGYGAGIAAVANLHGRIRKAAGILNKTRGMNIVFIAHADTETIELPDAEPYMRYSLRIGKRSVSHYVDDVDLVGLVKLQMFLTGGDDDKRKKAVSTGDRVITVNTSASSVTKNRFGLTEDIEFIQGVNPFINLIPFINGAK